MDDTTLDHGAKLRRVLSAFPGQGFAVLDGARFEDLPKLCRHLRTLNMARIPAWAAADGTVPPADGSGLEPMPVMFRHWDPRVLGALLPALDGAQFARVLGPAAEIAFLAVDHGGVRRVVADSDLPNAPSGMLTIRSNQIEALNERRLDASHRRIAAALRTSEPAVTSSIDDVTLLTHVQISDVEGRLLGITGERAHGAWAYLMLMSHGRVVQSQQAREFIARGERPPDEQVGRLVSMRETWLERVTLDWEAGHGGTV